MYFPTLEKLVREGKYALPAILDMLHFLCICALNATKQGRNRSLAATGSRTGIENKMARLNFTEL